ncbi:glycosyltransferase [Rossellomorea aquimaris]|nr:glycosyltransferase [Rossellomorea aquimaris]WRP06317.1 glycosyltransferase [Rossellomorea aquimaris]
MKNILFITYHFPPMNGSTSTMNFQIVKNLSEKFRVFVLTVNVSEGEVGNTLLKRLNNNVSIYRSDLGFLHKHYYKKSKEAEKTYNAESKIRVHKRLMKRVKKIAHNTKERMLLPDPVIDWYPVAIKKIKNIIDDINPDYIISSASPYTSHLIGHNISRVYNIPHILYYGDPWVYEQSRKRGFFRFHLEKRIEKKILKHAIKVYVVTETTRKLYIDKYPIEPSKVDITRSGFDPEDYSYSESHYNEKLTMIYGGALNPIHRNPLPFFEAISTLKDDVKNEIHFKLYTNEVEKYNKLIRERGLETVIEVKPIIAYENFIKELVVSDLLILFGNSSSLQIPGKVYDYIGSLTKILLINNTSEYINDPTYKLLNSYEENFYSINESNEIKNVLYDIHNRWRKKGLGKNNYKNVEHFTWSRSLTKLIEFIEEH